MPKGVVEVKKLLIGIMVAVLSFGTLSMAWGSVRYFQDENTRFILESDGELASANVLNMKPLTAAMTVDDFRDLAEGQVVELEDGGIEITLRRSAVVVEPLNVGIYYSTNINSFSKRLPGSAPLFGAYLSDTSVGTAFAKGTLMEIYPEPFDNGK
jgi:hypothetical protein